MLELQYISKHCRITLMCNPPLACTTLSYLNTMLSNFEHKRPVIDVRVTNPDCSWDERWNQNRYKLYIRFIVIICIYNKIKRNKANLRDLIAATGLVILVKLDSNRRILSPCDLEIWWMTLKNNRAPLLYYIKLCASFRSHCWIQTGGTVRKRPIWVKIDGFLAAWPCNLTDDLEKQ